MKCSNCDKDALFVYQLTLNKVIPYCGKHLPAFLETRRKADLLKTTEAWSKEKESALATLEFKTKKQEEPVVEEKPKKKTTKKKSE